MLSSGFWGSLPSDVLENEVPISDAIASGVGWVLRTTWGGGKAGQWMLNGETDAMPPVAT